jgi:hypothetical protein
MSWRNYKNKIGKLNSLYTILLWGLPMKEQIDLLYKELLKINKFVKDSYKKKKANDVIYTFLKYIENIYDREDIVNGIFFIDVNIDEFILTKNEINVCKEWKIDNLILKYNDRFEIDYLDDLLYNLEYTNVIHLNKKILCHLYYNPTKIKQINKIEVSSVEEVDEYIKLLDNGVIHGLSSFIKRINNKSWDIYSKKLDKDKILNIIKTNKALIIHKQLEENVLNNLTNPKYNNLFVFGKKKINKAIQNSMLKELYITKKLKNILIKNISKEKLNFKIYELIRLKKNDITNIFIKNYDGLIGVYYYPQTI